MPYSEKQIAEWAEKLADKLYGFQRPEDIAKMESAARALIATVRKETREECARDAERYRWLRDGRNNWHWSIRVIQRAVEESEHGNYFAGEEKVIIGPELDAAIDAAIRNLQEREEGKT